MEKCPDCGGRLINPVKAEGEYPRYMTCAVCSWPLSFSCLLERIKKEKVAEVILATSFSPDEEKMNEEEGLDFLKEHNNFAFPLFEDKDAVAFKVENDKLIFKFTK